jgi:hypothetical protein
VDDSAKFSWPPCCHVARNAICRLLNGIRGASKRRLATKVNAPQSGFPAEDAGRTLRGCPTLPRHSSPRFFVWVSHCHAGFHLISSHHLPCVALLASSLRNTPALSSPIPARQQLCTSSDAHRTMIWPPFQNSTTPLHVGCLTRTTCIQRGEILLDRGDHGHHPLPNLSESEKIQGRRERFNIHA